MRAERKDVMLAYPGDEGRIRRLGDQVFAQPKLKGVRCRLEWFHDDPVLISSYGIEFRYLDHIKGALSGFQGIPLDGEIYVHGWTQEEINSASKRKVNESPESAKLQYHVFDIQWQDQSQWYREHFLLNMEERGYFSGPILFKVDTQVIHNLDWLKWMTMWVEQGYEGIILRNPIEPYQIKRFVGLIKIKPTEEDEYVITAVREAIDKHGNPKEMVGAFQVQDREGISFFVGAGKLKHDERIKYWNIRHRVPGNVLVVKHEPDVTKGGVPVCAVAIRIKMVV